jgi:hypothetical protein
MIDGSPLQYATYFDKHYLSRGLALYRSLRRHSPPFVLWVLCLDEEVERVLTVLELEHVILVPLAELERVDPAVPAVKAERLLVEYYWTCGPAFLCYVLERDSRIRMLTYLDADLYFFSDPTPLYQELGDGSILIAESRRFPFRPDVDAHLGKYNVGFIIFRATPSGLACLRRWREQCIEWCFERFEENRFGDQAYLDDWPDRFDGVRVVQYPGYGSGPSNVLGAQVDVERGRILLNRTTLIHYHFTGVRRINQWVYEMHHWRFTRRPAPLHVRRRIYAPYVRELQAVETSIRQAGGHLQPNSVGRRVTTAVNKTPANDHKWRQAPIRWQRFIFVMGGVVL